MSAFNIVMVPWVAAGTHDEYQLKVQFKYGETWQYVYQIGDVLRWGGNDVGRPGARWVVVDGCLEGEAPAAGVPTDWEVHILDNKIERVVPVTGAYDFVGRDEAFIIIED